MLSLAFDICEEEEGDAEGLITLSRVMVPYFLLKKPERLDSKYNRSGSGAFSKWENPQDDGLVRDHQPLCWSLPVPWWVLWALCESCQELSQKHTWRLGWHQAWKRNWRSFCDYWDSPQKKIDLGKSTLKIWWVKMSENRGGVINCRPYIYAVFHCRMYNFQTQNVVDL